jgi:hypothetical protein
MPPIRIALLLVLAALTGTASAQKAYRYVYPDGRVVYSDKPVPGARLQGEVAAPPPPTVAPAPPGGASGAQKAAGEDPAATRVNRLAKADEEVRAAEEALNQARLRQIAGREPLPGERTGTVSGKSRLNEGYEERQRALEKEVTDAEARLDRAVAARNAVR